MQICTNSNLELINNYYLISTTYYLFKLIKVSSIESEVVIVLELASNPLWVVIILVNSVDKSTFDDSSEPDVILSPITPTVACNIKDIDLSKVKNYYNDIYAVGANLAGLPAITVPSGKYSNKMPIGLQFIGDAFREDNILKVAYNYELWNGGLVWKILKRL